MAVAFTVLCQFVSTFIALVAVFLLIAGLKDGGIRSIRYYSGFYLFLLALVFLGSVSFYGIYYRFLSR